MIAAYIEIAHHLLTNVTALRMIDIDQGQLDEPDSFEPILPPTVLIGGLELEAVQQGQKVAGVAQLLMGTVTLKTVLTLMNDTHVTKLADLDRFAKKLEVLQTAHEVREAMELLPNVLRMSHKEYHVSVKKGTSFYVVEQKFSLEYEDDQPDGGRYLTAPDDFMVKLNLAIQKDASFCFRPPMIVL